MDKLEKKLQEIVELIKKMPLMPSVGKAPALNTPSVKSPRPAETPKAPGLKATSKKDPLKVAQQLKDPVLDDMKPKEIQEIASVLPNGQWKLSSKPSKPKIK